MGAENSKCKGPEAAMFLNVFDNIREARVAGERLDCGFNETLLWLENQ